MEQPQAPAENGQLPNRRVLSAASEGMLINGSQATAHHDAHLIMTQTSLHRITMPAPKWQQLILYPGAMAPGFIAKCSKQRNLGIPHHPTITCHERPFSWTPTGCTNWSAAYSCSSLRQPQDPKTIHDVPEASPHGHVLVTTTNVHIIMTRLEHATAHCWIQDVLITPDHLSSPYKIFPPLPHSVWPPMPELAPAILHKLFPTSSSPRPIQLPLSTLTSNTNPPTPPACAWSHIVQPPATSFHIAALRHRPHKKLLACNGLLSVLPKGVGNGNFV